MKILKQFPLPLILMMYVQKIEILGPPNASETAWR